MKCKAFIVLSLLYLSCNNVEKKNVVNSASSTEQEDFDNFFIKFRSTPSFRLNRTKFPLKGYNSDEKEIGSKDTLYIWNRENFKFYSDEDFKNQTTTNLIKENITKSDSSIVYRRYMEDSGYNISYKFNSINDNWYLVYYSYKNY